MTALPYRRPKPWFLIGVDMSYESLRANAGIDLPVYASAGERPLADHSVLHLRVVPCSRVLRSRSLASLFPFDVHLYHGTV